MTHIFAVELVFLVLIQSAVCPVWNEFVKCFKVALRRALVELENLIQDFINFDHIIDNCDLTAGNIFDKVLVLVVFVLFWNQCRAMADLSETFVFIQLFVEGQVPLSNFGSLDVK